MHLFGDVVVKSADTNSDAICEALRQTMVNQDVLFQKQVLELHRLYSVQKSLMGDPNWIQSEIDERKYELLAKGGSYFDMSLVGSFESSCRGQAKKHWGGFCKLPFPLPDLRQQQSVPPVVKNHLLTNVIVIDLEDDEIATPRKAENSTREKDELSHGMIRKPHSIPVIIDLDEDEGCTSSDGKTSGKEDKDSVRGVPFILGRGSSLGIDLNEVYNDDDSASCYSDACIDANPSVIDPAYVSKRLTSGYHHIDFPPSNIHRKIYHRRSKDDSSNANQQIIYSRLESDSTRHPVDRESTSSKCEVDHENKLGLIDLNCAPETLLDPLEDVGSYSANSVVVEHDFCQRRHFINGVDSEGDLDFSEKRQIHSTSPEADLKGSEDQAFVSSCSYETPKNTNAASWRSNSFNGSTSSQKTPQSKVEIGDANMCSPTKLTTDAGVSVAGCMSSDINPRPRASRRLCYSSTDEEPTPNVTIQEAAIVLVHLSVVASFAECENKTGLQDKEKNNMCENKAGSQDKEKNDILDYSSDSFEANTLRLVESSADDYFKTSNAYEVSDMEKKDSGLKLMRGRRMKDFQKDILPNLSSLSGQEIQEDISILVGVMRSREYRKMRAKMGEDTSWCLPRRCKRSRR